MQALHFGDPDRPLFGVYQPPIGPAPAHAAALLCNPVGQEYCRAHWAFRRLAGKLAVSGFHVFRFDYSCTGDSAGGCAEADMGRWKEDVLTAADEALSMSGESALCVVGLRLGAALAATALAGGAVARLRHLVLWDPVVDGRSYLAELEAVHAQKTAFLRAVIGRGGGDGSAAHPDEIMGFSWPDAVRGPVGSVRLLETPPPATARVALVVSEERREYSALRERYAALNLPVEYRAAPGDTHWDLYSPEMENTLLAGIALNAIDALLSGGREP
jgi:alpha/beta superfamily hydrolase